MSNYLPRISDRLLGELLASSGAVLVEGAKWCGKTSSAREFSASQLYMQDPDRRQAYMQMADARPSLLLQGAVPRLIDEWQDAPVLWAAVEVKMGHKQEEEAAANLLKLAGKVNAEKMGQPSFLMILTAGEMAYRRSDGVLVVPIGCLKD